MYTGTCSEVPSWVFSYPLQAQNQLERSIDVVNSSCLMRNYRIFKNGMFQYGISLLMSLLVAFLYITVGLSETFGSRDVNDMWNTHVNPGIFLLFISFPLVIFILRKFRNKVRIPWVNQLLSIWFAWFRNWY